MTVCFNKYVSSKEDSTAKKYTKTSNQKPSIFNFSLYLCYLFISKRLANFD